MRFKQLEEERETEKNKWLMFSSKVRKRLIRRGLFCCNFNHKFCLLDVQEGYVEEKYFRIPG